VALDHDSHLTPAENNPLKLIIRKALGFLSAVIVGALAAQAVHWTVKTNNKNYDHGSENNPLKRIIMKALAILSAVIVGALAAKAVHWIVK
jgi:hypothetical protein